ncbi:MAG TPA: DUF169 domain-containing protein [Dehalococcoidia bacterium]|nr:DUF169 domain-containing protein [Dehalococcoidia bacterium]
MLNLKDMHQWAEELERRLRLKTFPLAVKLLEKEEHIPEGAMRPIRDLGYHLPLCQGYAMSRREGTVVAMLKQDMWCFEPVVGYGLVESPQYFLEGCNRFPQDVKTLEAGRNYASDFPRLETGKYIGVASAPLTTANFEPDLVIIYCDSSQLSLLLLGREYKDGHDLKCSLSSHAACVYSVVPVMQSGECRVAIPCRGDHYMAIAGDDELIFTVPKEKLEDLMVGLRYLETTGSKLPRNYQTRREPEFPESYMKIAKMIGMLEDK